MAVDDVATMARTLGVIGGDAFGSAVVMYHASGFTKTIADIGQFSGANALVMVSNGGVSMLVICINQRFFVADSHGDVAKLWTFANVRAFGAKFRELMCLDVLRHGIKCFVGPHPTNRLLAIIQVRVY